MKLILISTLFTAAASAAVYQAAAAASPLVAADTSSYASGAAAADPIFDSSYGAAAAADVPIVPEPTFGPAYGSVQADVAAEANVNYNLLPYLNVRPGITHGPFQDSFQGYPQLLALPYGRYYGGFRGVYSTIPFPGYLHPAYENVLDDYIDSPFPFYPEFGRHHHHHHHHHEKK